MPETAKIIAGVATVWDFLRDRQPDLPPVAVVLTTTGAPHDLRYPEDTGDIHGAPIPPDLAIHVDTLNNGGRAVIECVLHMATHALCHVRGVSETSNRGRRHNRKFADMATEFGCEWPEGEAPHSVRGWSPVPMTPDMATVMEPYMSALDTIIETAGDVAASVKRQAKPSNRAILTCDCGRKAQMGRRVAAQGPVICGVCRTEFRER